VTLTEWMRKNPKKRRARDVARRTKISEATISRFLNGVTTMSVPNMLRIVEATRSEVTLMELAAEGERLVEQRKASEQRAS
jgi:transcriptional regulator with XRE-family HTH domain